MLGQSMIPCCMKDDTWYILALDLYLAAEKLHGAEHPDSPSKNAL